LQLFSMLSLERKERIEMTVQEFYNSMSRASLILLRNAHQAEIDAAESRIYTAQKHIQMIDSALSFNPVQPEKQIEKDYITSRCVIDAFPTVKPELEK
jgi:hypothetical protein